MAGRVIYGPWVLRNMLEKVGPFTIRRVTDSVLSNMTDMEEHAANALSKKLQSAITDGTNPRVTIAAFLTILIPLLDELAP